MIERAEPFTHRLKTWPRYFQAVVEGRKTFECRKDDRSYAEGDTALLEEWVPSHESPCSWNEQGLCSLCGRMPGQPLPGHYTGRQHGARITYVARGTHIPEGMCVFSLAHAPTTVDLPLAELEAMRDTRGVPPEHLVERVHALADELRLAYLEIGTLRDQLAASRHRSMAIDDLATRTG